MAEYLCGIDNIERTECIGSSLTKINGNFTQLDQGVCDAFSELTRLQTLITTLSSSMQNIGNYPYARFDSKNQAAVALNNSNIVRQIFDTTYFVSSNITANIDGSGNITITSPGTYKYRIQTLTYDTYTNNGISTIVLNVLTKGAYSSTNGLNVENTTLDVMHNGGSGGGVIQQRSDMQGQLTVTTPSTYHVNTFVSAQNHPNWADNTIYTRNIVTWFNTSNRITNGYPIAQFELWKID